MKISIPLIAVPQLFVFTWLISSACAEELIDPTRPPLSILMPAAQSGVVATDKSSSLQSVIISKNRRAAIIDGLTVELGAKSGDARLIEVNPASVVLRTSQGRQVLKLYPDVTITSARTETPSIKIHKPAVSREKK